MRKFTESIDVSDWEIETDSGWEDISHFHTTIPYDVWIILLEDNFSLEAADDHIVFDENLNEVFIKDLSVGDFVMTEEGPKKVESVIETARTEEMFDLTVDSDQHRFYSNGILSHNTTIATVIILHFALFNSGKRIALLANKGDQAREILDRIQLAFEGLPDFLKVGIIEWNKGTVVFENRSKIVATATSGSAIRGKTQSLVYIDETAFVENWAQFSSSVLPTLSSGKKSKLIFTSTPNGLNHFYKYWVNARKPANDPSYNGFYPIEVPWYLIPGRDEAWRQQVLSDIDFDEEKFKVEYECEFMGSSGTLVGGWKLKELVHINPIVESKNGLRVYEKPVEGAAYAIIADVSRGKGLDYSAFSVFRIDKMPYRQVAIFRDNQTTPTDYAAILHRIGMGYNEATILVEINDIGGQVSDILYMDYEYENLIFTESAGRAGKKISGGFGNNADSGIRTTKTVKAQGCSMLKLLVEQNQLIINDFDTIQELSTFSKKGNSYEAEQGKHDDLVMGLVLFGWFSSQPYFKDVTDINTIGRLRDKSDEDLLEDLVPFGFIDNGLDNYEDENRNFWNEDASRTQGKRSEFDSDEFMDIGF